MDWLLTTGLSATAGAWGAHAGLGDEVGRLRSVLSRVHALVERAEQWRFANPGVADLLARLRDAACDAEDLADELATDEKRASQSLFPSVRGFLRGLVTGAADRARAVSLGSSTRPRTWSAPSPYWTRPARRRRGARSGRRARSPGGPWFLAETGSARMWSACF
ncbi:hypothetical protein VPH35_022303 [Triticum aestivum]